MKREDDFEVRRMHIANLTDEELYDRFWALTQQVVDTVGDYQRDDDRRWFGQRVTNCDRNVRVAA